MKNRIVEMAKEVFETLGCGFREDVYGQALAIEFRKAGIKYGKEHNCEIFYKGECVGVDRPDFIIGNLIVELKAKGKLNESDVAQLNTYLRSLKKKRGMVINFPTTGEEIEVECN